MELKASRRLVWYVENCTLVGLIKLTILVDVAIVALQVLISRIGGEYHEQQLLETMVKAVLSNQGLLSRVADRL